MHYTYLTSYNNLTPFCLDAIRKIEKVKSYFNGTFKVWLGSDLFFVLDDVEDCTVVLNNAQCMDKPHFVNKQVKTLADQTLFGIEGKDENTVTFVDFYQIVQQYLNGIVFLIFWLILMNSISGMT